MWTSVCGHWDQRCSELHTRRQTGGFHLPKRLLTPAVNCPNKIVVVPADLVIAAAVGCLGSARAGGVPIRLLPKEWVGGSRGQKKVFVPKVGLKFPARLINFIFCLGKIFLMWVGWWVNWGWPGPKTPPPSPPNNPLPPTPWGPEAIAWSQSLTPPAFVCVLADGSCSDASALVRF